jgi:hypothetical protein
MDVKVCDICRMPIKNIYENRKEPTAGEVRLGLINPFSLVFGVPPESVNKPQKTKTIDDMVRESFGCVLDLCEECNRSFLATCLAWAVERQKKVRELIDVLRVER